MEHIIASASQLGSVLQGYRKQRRLTQAQAAARVGMHPKTISLLETGSGEGVSLSSILKLLSALDVEFVLRPKPVVENPGDRKALRVAEPEW
jgi:transcriptional regulator with XRE-family HTH domain